MKKNQQKISIETPEHFELQFELAGIGTRFLAYLADRLIQIGVFLAVLLVAWAVGYPVYRVLHLHEWSRQVWPHLGRWALAGVILVYGIVFLGYFMLFEYFWSGSTPGKRWQRIRVIRKDGRPISFLDSAIRNILRFVDILAGVYPVGLIVMFLDSWTRRLGDLAAGTLVVIDERQDRPALGGARAEGPSDPELRRVVMQMTADDYQLVARFLSRQATLEPPVRSKLAGKIVQRIFKESQYVQAGQPDLEDLLATAAKAYREKTRIL